MEEKKIPVAEFEECLFAVAALVDFHRLAYMDYHTYIYQSFNPSVLEFDESSIQQMHLALNDFFVRMSVFRKYKRLASRASKRESKKEVDTRRTKYSAVSNTRRLKRKQPALVRLARLNEESAETEVGSLGRRGLSSAKTNVGAGLGEQSGSSDKDDEPDEDSNTGGSDYDPNDYDSTFDMDSEKEDTAEKSNKSGRNQTKSGTVQSKIGVTESHSGLNDEPTLVCPKLHLLTHFCSYILWCGSLRPHSTNTEEMAIRVYVEGFSHTNKGAYIGKVFRYMAHKEAMICKVAYLRYILEKCEIEEDSEIRKDIERYTSLYQNVRVWRKRLKEIKIRLGRKNNCERQLKRRQASIKAALNRDIHRESLKAHAEEILGAKLERDPFSSSSSESNSSEDDGIKEGSTADLQRGIDTSFYRIRRPERKIQIDSDETKKIGDQNTIGRTDSIKPPCPKLTHQLKFAQRTGSSVIASISDILVQLSKLRFVPEEDLLNELHRSVCSALNHTIGLDDLKSMDALAYRCLCLSRTRFQFPYADVTDLSYKIHCTPLGYKVDQRGRKRRNDFVAFTDGSQTFLANEKIGRVELFFSVQYDEELRPTRPGGRTRWKKRDLPLEVIRLKEWQARTKQQAARRIFKGEWSEERVKVIPVRSIVRAVSVVPIIGPVRWNQPYSPPDSHRQVDDMIYKARGFIVNNRVDDETFNTYL